MNFFMDFYRFYSMVDNIFSPLTVESFKEIIDLFCEDVINYKIADNIILEVIKNPTISPRQVKFYIYS